MKKLLVSLFLFSLFQPLFSASLQQDAEEEIKAFYGENCALTFSKRIIDSAIKKQIEKKATQAFRKNFVYYWTINSGSTLHHAMLDQVKAKSAIITVLAMFNTNGTVEKISIIKYNGDKGRNVMDEHWLGQFEGLDKTSDFNIGTGVDGMTGATFSASAIALGVYKWSLLVNSFTDENSSPVRQEQP